MNLLEEQNEVSAQVIEQSRECSRCEGHQHLTSEYEGMGKYVCDTCNMMIGFDLDADPSEFLLHRGLPFQYTKNIFGSRLLPVELERTTGS